MNETDFLLSEVKRMQRFYKPSDLPFAIAEFVNDRYYPREQGPQPEVALKPVPQGVTLERIKEVVLPYYNITWEMVTRRSRKQEIVKTRMKIMYFLRTRGKMNLQAIADIFEMDHTTVIHNRDKLVGMIGNDVYLRREIEYLNSQL